MVRLRFAPSPTGYLHVGNARTALVNFLFARAAGGELLLRLDDTDAARGRPEYEQAIHDDLRWLGLDWDLTARQSERLARYAAAAERLKAAGRLYPCFEGEEELAAKRAALLKRRLPPVYDRAALGMTPEQLAAAAANGKRPYWRFKLSDAAIAWQDLVLGGRSVRLATLSDPVLIRADGTPLYTFTSVVDDLDHAITHVLRGEDHVTNTAVQIDLLQAMGASHLPRFAHLPLISDPRGEKLSKRLGSISIRSMRKDGIEAAAITAFLARLGTRQELAPLPLTALIEAFDIADFGRAPPRFDPLQLLALNRKILHGLEFDAVRDRLPAGADAAFWLAIRGNLDLLREAGMWWQVVAGEIAPAGSGGTDYLAAAAGLLPPEPWGQGSWREWTARLGEATGAKGKALFQPLRLALTGEAQGPEMAALLPLIGRARALRRLTVPAALSRPAGAAMVRPPAPGRGE